MAVLSDNLGSIAMARGEPVEAQACYERALRIYQKHLGDEHPCAIAVKNHLTELM